MKNIGIIFDLDDTLIVTNSRYVETNQKTAALIYDFFQQVVNVEVLLKFQRQLDIQLVKEKGLTPERYVLSWVLTAKHFAETARILLTDEMIAAIEKSADEVHQLVFDLYPHAVEILKSFSRQGFDLHLLTAGDDRIQSKRIKDAKISHFFKSVTIVPFKTPATLQELIWGFDEKEHDYIMIGNSLKSDIYPALENDVYGLHVEKTTWELDHHDIDSNHPKYIKVNDLIEAEKTVLVKFA